MSGTHDGFIQYWRQNGVYRPALQIEARGHGVFTAPDKWSTVPFTHSPNFPGGDGIIYWYRGKDGFRGAESPNPTTTTDLDVAYDLIWIDAIGGLWDHRGIEPNLWSIIAGMSPSGDVLGRDFISTYIGGEPLQDFTCGVLSLCASPPKPPWAFDVDGDTAERGWWLLHPIGVAMAYFDIPGMETEQYTYNPYWNGQAF